MAVGGEDVCRDSGDIAKVDLSKGSRSVSFVFTLMLQAAEAA